jgi:hypothetical protein
MPTHHERFFLRIPEHYLDMTEADQKAAVLEMWRAAMIQMGEDPDKLTGDRATAQNEHTDDGHEL